MFLLMRCMMKKNLIISALVLISMSTCAYGAEGYVFSVNNKVNSSVQINTNAPSYDYLKFYDIDAEMISARIKVFDNDKEKNFIKTLSKADRENYKYAKKIEKLVQKEKWDEIYSKYPNYLPAYLEYYGRCISSNNYQEALNVLGKIQRIDRYNMVISADVLNYAYAMLYYNTYQYSNALRYFKIFEFTKDDGIYSSIGNCYYYLNNYQTAINYYKKIKKPTYENLEYLFSAYLKLGNTLEANKFAKNLLNENYNFKNLMRVEATTSDDVEKLTYAYKARSLAQTEEELVRANAEISALEQKKLDTKVAKLTQFIKVPKWSEYEKQIPQNVLVKEISDKQDEFFKTANMYLSKYSGQQLTNAFKSLNEDFTNFVAQKKQEYYQEKQIQAQKELVLEQQRNNMLQQQLIEEQRMHNYLERQNFYYMTRPYYYYRSPRFYW